MSSRPSTLGLLRASGWQSVPVKEEIRRNAVTKILAGEPMFEGVLGFEETVMPQLKMPSLLGTTSFFSASAAGQDPDHPLPHRFARRWIARDRRLRDQRRSYEPVSKYARDLVAEHGDDTGSDGSPRRSLRRGIGHARHVDRRFIGAIDPIKVAEGRYSLRRAHTALRPCPAHEPRISRSTSTRSRRAHPGRSVNVLEERDVQVRVTRSVLPLDVMWWLRRTPRTTRTAGASSRP